MQLSISCQHNGSEVAQALSDLAGRIDRVPGQAMPRLVERLRADVAAEIERIAGGVYWDIQSDLASEESSATGRVWTDRSRPHVIEPHDPRHPLIFREGGELVVAEHVDHPGSRPVNWVPGVSQSFSGTAKSIFDEQMDQAVRGGSSGAGSNSAAPVGGL